MAGPAAKADKYGQTGAARHGATGTERHSRALISRYGDFAIMFMHLLRSDIAPDPRSRCKECGSTAYRKVIARDAQGRLTPNGMYQCCGCPLQFKSLAEWRGVPARVPFLGRMGPQASLQGQLSL
jgi:hypothetical protein